MAKKNEYEIKSPEDLNKQLRSAKPFTWCVLVAVILTLTALFLWSFFTKITYKIEGIAHISSGEATLVIDKKRLPELEVGQKVYISNIEGQIMSIKDDRTPVITTFELEDGDYTYLLIIKIIRPIDYFTRK